MRGARCIRERSQAAALDKYTSVREGVSGGKLMTMVSVMKKVTLFMMVLALAVSLAACQGAVGPKGDDGAKGDTGAKGDQGDQGDKGDKGDQGDPGDRGPMGYSTLVAKAGIAAIPVNDGEQRGEAIVGVDNLPGPIMVSDYFLGGYPEITYSLAKWLDHDDNTATAMVDVAPDSVFTVVLKDGVITVAKRAEGAVALTGTDRSQGVSTETGGILEHYGMGTGFQVSAKDETGNTVTTATIYVRRNRAPTNIDARSYGALTVGTQDGLPPVPDPLPAGTTEASWKADACNRFNVGCLHGNYGGDRTADDAESDDVFADDNVSDLDFNAVSSANDYATAAVDDGNVMVTGVKGDMKDGNPTIKMVDIDVTAVDEGKLMSTAELLTVNVDPQPILKSTPTPLTLKADGEVQVAIRNIMSFFNDNDSDTTTDGHQIDLDFTAEEVSDPDNAIVIPATPVPGTGDTNAGHLTIQGDNVGSAEIKIKATEGAAGALGQFVEVTVTITVEEGS